MTTCRPVVLLTDFGPQSAYVGQMKLVLATAGVQVVVDLAHDLPPRDLKAAALSLLGARRFLPPRSITVVVVDPGVGGARRILAARTADGRFLLVPDNGLLAPLLHAEAQAAATTAGGKRHCRTAGRRGQKTAPLIRTVENREFFAEEVSPVFHGRDIFAPTAARLACGARWERVGPLVAAEETEPAPWGEPARSPAGELRGEVVYVDRFGNLVTNLPNEAADELPAGRAELVVGRGRGRRRVRVRTHYAAARAGKFLAAAGSFGFLELAVRDGHAARLSGLSVGAPAVLRRFRS